MKLDLLRWAGPVSAYVFIIAAVLLAGFWQSNLRILSVQTGSMAPLLSPGDAILVKRANPLTIQPGDTVSYQSATESNKIITHRMLAADPLTGQMVTKGDANPDVDQPAAMTSVLGKVVYSIPQAGHVIDWLHSWPGVMLAVYIPAGAILTGEFIRVGRHYLRPTYSLHRHGVLDNSSR